jgi:SAM-dependent methyltransferase
MGIAISRALRQVRRWSHKLQSALGIRRGVKVRGAYFKELTAESLQRALSKKGRGWKDYRVTFPDGAKLVIRCSPQRIFDDLMGPLGFDAGQGILAPLLEIIRPGSRLLLVNAGTGAAGAWLGAAVGSSGAVVALEQDEQSVTFAAKRYPRPNVSYERGSVEELTGETDASFEGAVVIRPIEAGIVDAALTEIWRVVAPGGWLLISCGAGQGDAVSAHLKRLPAGDATGIRSDATGGPDLVFATKLSEPLPNGTRNRGAPGPPAGDGPSETMA